ncbi:uncharacterized protein Eint_081670 [Encephalitozoon intestinalis ATCC 50506]|uniref:Ricin B lectin domain-containing protein n=1 Tax=Encephalitozoon intestinalis (strain ATCC 50506) TaxID=876142 RepID=E0S8R1_ENCIT|nr:uncharacterized protein Eint_081670 [Encephalitozoon intestinalis ATCC 50506]ADM12099.1 hypothetical protein Eint_081670 [Encephalitozoon intestinalis ATCC 50506]UTX45892.1 hypothetical protein GPK93_08g14710 [Encephalitozoon intestinalis]
MKSIFVVFQLVKVISGFTIFTKDGQRKHLVKGGIWRSPDYNLDYQLAAMSASGTPVEFKTENLSSGIKVIKVSGSNDVLDLHNPRSGQSKLIFHGRNNGSTQKFSIEGSEGTGFTIKNGTKCLEYDASGNIYGTTCSSSAQQTFDIVYSPDDPEYKPPSPVAEVKASSAEDIIAELNAGNPNPQAPQIFIFNEKSEKKRKNSHSSDSDSNSDFSPRRRHHHHHYSLHESPYFTY